ncbi:MAG: hypothetical protein DHS20C09_14760 [marine bacterium B5-7]|nr:MAG: hypothetical protein DHS20C09_14760 [marine bacterium B5-7]
MHYLGKYFIFLFLFPAQIFAGEIFDDLPKNINPDEKYIFYSHGYSGVGGTSEITTSLSDPAYNLIAYHRPVHTYPSQYSRFLASQVDALISEGVKPRNITLMGYSDGGVLSILTSSELANDEINVVILAGCAGVIKVNPIIEVYGDVYSIYDNEDELAGSCQFLIDRSKHEKSFTELIINTGKGHGAFRTATDEWITPVKKWIKSIPD